MADYSLQNILETQVIDKMLPVIVAGDTALEEKIAKLGTRVGSADTWADLPTLDQNGKAVTVGDVARLNATDGAHAAGLYERKADNSGWEETPYMDFDALGISQIIADAKAAAGDIVVNADGSVTATVDDKFTTPKQVGDAVQALAEALAVINADAYHPKGGDDTLAVVGKNGQEATQEFVTANQLAATFTTAEIQAKYDAL